MTSVMGRWWRPGIAVAGAVALLVAPNGVLVTVMAVLLLLYAWIISPAFFPRSADLQVALERAADGQAPLVFWKPGCIFCIRLRVGVGPTGGRVSWVDSSRDKEARAVVRSKNGGDHTTPTVMFRDEIRTNPQVEWVRTLLR